MPAWAVAILGSLLKATAQAALPIALKILQKSGIINGVEAWGVQTGTHIIQAVRVEDTYPEDKETSGAS